MGDMIQAHQRKFAGEIYVYPGSLGDSSMDKPPLFPDLSGLFLEKPLSLTHLNKALGFGLYLHEEEFSAEVKMTLPRQRSIL